MLSLLSKLQKINTTTIMNKNYFEIKRAGINTTFQDQGRSNLYHIGIPFSGAMDNRNFQISNKLVGNETNSPVIEFAYQGPLLKYFGDNIKCAIAGDVKFTIKKNDNDIEGNCYQSFTLENGDEIDIITTELVKTTTNFEYIIFIRCINHTNSFHINCPTLRHKTRVKYVL